MSLYFISYDLINANPEDYEVLYEALEKLGAVRILDSTWCFNSNSNSAKALRKWFQQYMDSGDGLIVSEVSRTNWASRNAEKTPKDL